MGHVYGATVDLCGPVHGQVQPIEQQQSAADPLWKDIPRQLDVTRYHSLAVSLRGDSPEKNIPLLPTAYSTDGQRVLMGMSHKENPHYGVQFHPESIGSEHGHQLLRNFCDACRKQQFNRGTESSGISEGTQLPPRPHGHDRQATIDKADGCKLNSNKAMNTPVLPKAKYEVLVHKLPTKDVAPLEVFEEFLADEQYSVWLDTSIGVQSANTDLKTPSYSSILGASNITLEYFGKEHELEKQGLFRYDTEKERRIKVDQHDILTFLQDEHSHATGSFTLIDFEDDAILLTESSEDEGDLPFDFRGGHVGYLGYEVRHDTEQYLEQEEQGSRSKWKPVEESLKSPPLPLKRTKADDTTPTAAFLFLDKSFVYDHSRGEWYLLSLVKTGQNTDSALGWMQRTAHIMESLSKKKTVNNDEDGGLGQSREAKQPRPSTAGFIPNRSRVCYNQNFADCQEQIRLGESYELCLTNQLEANVNLLEEKSALDLYKVLRKCNPAPFSAFLNWNVARRPRASDGVLSDPSLAVCCSSPERFVSVKRPPLLKLDINGSRSETKLQVEAKPIKGTCARVIPKDPSLGLSPSEAEEDLLRAKELQKSVKNRAENLMIVDLLRNDLSRVCEVGSVHVSNLMDIESYATVHQMVSTIRGMINTEEANAVDVLKATFPGGSMTGAPKIRTMEILERLGRGVSRGPYSGCLGYISVNGCMDMNIIIRSAILKPGDVLDSEGRPHEWKVSIGAGGAITALSESTDEYEEMILKASAVIRAVEKWAGVPLSLTLSPADTQAKAM